MAPERMTRSSAKAANTKATKVPEGKRGRKPTKKNVETNSEIEIEGAPTSELEQSLKDVAAHEVHQVLTNVMPSVLKEMMKEMKKAEKKEPARKSVKGDDEEEESEELEREIELSDDSNFEDNGKGCNYGAFQRCRPPTFDGKKGSAATLEWLSEMEAVIDISECRVDQAVKFAAHSFTRAAIYWWTTMKQSKGRKAIREMVWEDLKKLMIKRFCPQYETIYSKIWVPRFGEIQKGILDEAHKSRYSIHPGGTKMYQDLKRDYWWPGMKREVEVYVSKCLTCLQVKAEHQNSYGKIQPLEIPERKWEHITMDFITKLPRTPKGYDTIWVVVDRLMKSAHFLPIKEAISSEKLAEVFIKEVVQGMKCRYPLCLAGTPGLRKSSGRNFMRRWEQSSILVQLTTHRPTDILKERSRPWMIYLEPNHAEGVPMDIGSFRIVARMGDVAYRLDLPKELSGIHPTFHVSHLRKCLADESMAVPYDDLEIDERLNYVEQPIAILEEKEK
ncbi:hypothetical protein QVD17_08482 [Tagetes erecta]|uniref:Integrase zinc-binding domain-containing protein n=1 Tax=Tagetes erecta TaxID=13708 RepID=A0AAD8KZI5_TARER|nr:hypothetical protein QVD17_08482 [Tagetes erecta]